MSRRGTTVASGLATPAMVSLTQPAGAELAPHSAIAPVAARKVVLPRIFRRNE